MWFNWFWERFVSFGLAFSISLFAAAFLYKTNFSDIFKKESKPAPKIVSSTNNGSGSAVCYPPSDKKDASEKATEKRAEKTTGVKIISKPRANYTNEARTNSVQGKVVLRVTFSANREIGSISVISGLPDGLTEQAINAAKGIEFKPATRGDVPYSVTKPVEYTFTIY